MDRVTEVQSTTTDQNTGQDWLVTIATIRCRFTPTVLELVEALENLKNQLDHRLEKDSGVEADLEARVETKEGKRMMLSFMPGENMLIPKLVKIFCFNFCNSKIVLTN